MQGFKLIRQSSVGEIFERAVSCEPINFDWYLYAARISTTIVRIIHMVKFRFKFRTFMHFSEIFLVLVSFGKKSCVQFWCQLLIIAHLSTWCHHFCSIVRSSNGLMEIIVPRSNLTWWIFFTSQENFGCLITFDEGNFWLVGLLKTHKRYQIFNCICNLA